MKRKRIASVFLTLLAAFGLLSETRRKTSAATVWTSDGQRRSKKKSLKAVTGSVLVIMLLCTMFMGTLELVKPEPAHAAGNLKVSISLDGGTPKTISETSAINDTITITEFRQAISMNGGLFIADGTSGCVSFVSGDAVKITKKGSGTINYANYQTWDVVVEEAHSHSWTYSASGRTITATCGGSGTCPVGTQTVTLGAVSNKTYNGTAQTAPTATKSTGWTSANGLANVGSVSVSPTNSANAGTYKASVSAGGKTATSSWTISRANISPTVSMSGWTYGGTASNPSVSGNTGSGAVTYNYKTKGAADSTYSTNKPSNAGNYTVRATIAQTTNYNSANATKDFTINRANIDPTVSMDGWAYGEEAKSPSVSGNTGNGAVTYEYKKQGALDETYSTTKPSDAGSYTVRATIAQTTNYNSATATTNFTIDKGDITPSIDDVEWTYGDAITDPLVKGNPGNGAVTYTYYTKSTCADNEKTSTTAHGAPYVGGMPTYAGTYYVKASVAESDNYNAGATEDAAKFTINQRPVTVASGITADDKVYDGKTAAVLRIPAITSANGKVGTDDVSITATGKFDSAQVGEDKTVRIQNMALAGAAAENYKLAESGQQETTTASISKLKATIQWSETVLTYNGESQKPVAEVTNLQTDDNGQTDTCTFKVTGEQTNAGAYTATAEELEGADAGNYDMPDEKFLTQAFTINKANAELVVDMDDWTYGGAAQNPQVEGAPADATTVIEYKPVNASSKEYKTEVPSQAGTYNIRVRATESRNYNVTEKVNTFTIKQREAELKWVEADSEDKIEFIYNADEQYPNGKDQCPKVIVTNLIGDDECIVTVSGASSAAGSHFATVTGLSNENYKLPAELIHEYTIKPADITPVISMNDWEYGSEQGTPSVEGNPGGGDVSYLYAVKGTTNWSSDKPDKVGEYTVQATIAATANYNGKVVTKDFKISKRIVQLTWSNVVFKHDGEEHIPTAVISNLRSGDDCEVTVTGAQTEVGDYTAVASALTGNDKDNYEITEESPKEQIFRISANDFDPLVIMSGWTYEGKNSAPKKEPVVEGNPGNGEVTYTYAKKGSDDFGTYEEKVGGMAGEYTVKASIAAAGGYNSAECTADFTIAKKTANIAWSGTRVTYNAEEQCPAATVTNLAGDDECTVTVTGGQTNAGEYAATAQSLSNDNYKLPDTVNQTFYIEKAALAITAEDKTILHGEDAPEFTARYAGFKGTEGLSDLTGTLAFDCSYEKGSKAGKYDIVPKGVSSNNYDISFVKGVLTVQNNQATIEKAPARKTITYNGYEQELVTPGTATNGVIYYSLNGSTWSSEVPKAKNVSSGYTVSWYLKANENYVSDSSETEPAGSLKNISIDRATLTVKAEDKRIQKGSAAPEYTAKYSGFVGEDDITALRGNLEFICSYKTGDEAGDYVIRPQGHQSDNYDINFENGKLTVWSAEAKITEDPAAADLTYSGKEQSLLTAGTAEHGKIYYRIDSGRWTDEVPKAKDAGKYSVSWYLKPDSGYTSDSSAAEPAGAVTVEIKRAALTITAIDKQIAKDAAAPEYTAKYEGFVNEETKDVLEGTLRFSCQYRKGDSVGEYEIVPSGLTSENYKITYVSGKLTVGSSGTASVEAPVAKDLTYSGKTQDLLTVKEAEHGTVFYRVNAGTWTTEVPAGQEAGKYLISWYVKPDDGYMSESSAAEPAGTITAEIKKANLTIRAENKEIAKDADAPEYTVKYEGFVNEETESVLEGILRISCQYRKGDSEGTYEIVPSGLTSDNYKITYVSGTLSVGSTGTASVQPPVANTLTYDGTEQTLLSVSEAVNGTVYYSLNGGAWSTEVPSGKDAGKYTVSWYVKADDGYTSESSAADPAGSIDVSIARRPLTVTAKNARIQKGQPAPAFSVEYSGFATGESSEVLRGTLEFTCDYSAGDDAGEYSIHPYGYQSENYDISYIDATLTVWSDTAGNVTAPEAKDLTYSGKTQTLVTAGTAEHGTIYYRVDNGLWSDEVPSATDAGKYSVSWYVKPDSGYTSSSSPAEPAGVVKAEIKKAALTITAEDKEIAKDAAAPEYTVKYEGFVNEETESVLEGTLRLDCQYRKGDSEGTYEIVPSGLTSENYKITYVSGTLTVGNSGTASVEEPVAKDLTYDGTEQTLLTVKEAQHGTVYYRLSNGKWSTEVPSGKDAGKYSVSWYVKADAGYTSNSSPAEPAGSVTVQIKKKALTVTAEDKEIKKDAAAPAYTVKYEGFVNEETEPVLEGTLRLDCQYRKGDSEGTYEIVPSGLTSENYKITYVSGTLTVGNSGTASVEEPVAKDLTYDGTEQTLLTVKEAQHGTVYYKVNGSTWSTELPSGKAAGKYSVNWYVKPDAGYVSESSAAEPAGLVVVEIKKAALKITAEDKEIAKEAAAPKYTVKYEGFVNDETESVLDGKLRLDCQYRKGDSEGTYEIVPSGLTSENYKITYVSGTLTVGISGTASVQAPVANDLTYDGTAQALLSVSQAENGTAYYRLNGGAWSTEVPTGEKAGEYSVSWYVKANDGYKSDSSAAEPAGTITVEIKKKALTVTAENKEIKKDSDAPAYTAKFDGFVNGETEAALEGTLRFDCKYRKGDSEGIYEIVPSGLRSGNYNITYVSGTLDVGSSGVAAVQKPAANELTYDGTAQTLLSVSQAVNGTAYYSLNGGKWSTEVPSVMDAGKYSVSWYVKEDAGYTSDSSAAEPAGTITVEVKKKDLSVTWVKEEGSEETELVYPYDGNTHVPFAILSGAVEGDDLTVSVTGKTSAPGTHEAKAIVSGDSMGNYRQPANSSVQFRNLDKEVISYRSEGYEGIANSSYHGITVKVDHPANAKVSYGLSGMECTLDESPTYKDAGLYTVYFKIEAENFETVTGRETIRINARSESMTPEVLTNLSKARYAKLMPKSSKQTKNSISLKWKKIKGTERYVVYGNVSKGKYSLKKLSTVKGSKNKFKLSRINATKLKKGTTYKFCVVAYDEDGKIIEKSAVIHVTTAGSKWKNHKKVKVKKPKKSKVTLKKKKKCKIKAVAVGKKVRKRVGLRYESTNKKVATVSKKGVIKAKGEGTCKVLVYAQNGKYKAIKVKVK